MPSENILLRDRAVARMARSLGAEATGHEFDPCSTRDFSPGFLPNKFAGPEHTCEAIIVVRRVRRLRSPWDFVDIWKDAWCVYSL